MKTTKNILALVVIVVVNMFAFAANAQDAAILAGVANSKGCYHYRVVDGQFEIKNCNGPIWAIVAKYANIDYKSSTPGSTSALEVGGQFGYRYNMWEPMIEATYTPSMTVEGCQFNALNVGLACNVVFNRHNKFNPYITPKVSYEHIECHEELTGENVNMDIPYSGNKLGLGVEVGTYIELGTIAKEKTAVVNGKAISYKKHSAHGIKVAVGASWSELTEPGMSKLKFSKIYASIGYFFGK